MMAAGTPLSVLSHGLFVPSSGGGGPTPTGALAATDRGDGTGANGTVSGSQAGSINRVFAFKLNGESGPVALPTSPIATRTGNGPLSLIVSIGVYFFYLTSDGEFRGGVHLAVTDGRLAVATRCRKAVTETLRLLTIDPAQRVYEQAFPEPSNVKFPCILTSVDGEQETDESGLSTRDDVGRPVKVGIYDRWSRRDHGKLVTWEAWRQACERCFRNQQLIGVPESKICRIEPFVIVDPNLPQFEFMVSKFIVRCVTREPRGIGA